MTGHSQVADIGVCIADGHCLQRLLIRIEQYQVELGIIPDQFLMNEMASWNCECLIDQAADIQDRFLLFASEDDIWGKEIGFCKG